jgi:hypothetical protein
VKPNTLALSVVAAGLALAAPRLALAAEAAADPKPADDSKPPT